MKTITSKRPPNANHLAASGLKLLSLSALSVAAIGCSGGIELQAKRPTFEVQAEFGGVANAQAAAAPAPDGTAPASYDSAPPAQAGAPAGPYAQSGGATLATAEVTTPGNILAGRVARGAPRFYAIVLRVGDAISIKTYGRQLGSEGFAEFTASIIEPDGVQMAYKTFILGDGPERLERKTLSVTAGQAGRHHIKLRTTYPVEYRIEITSVNQAGK